MLSGFLSIFFCLLVFAIFKACQYGKCQQHSTCLIELKMSRNTAMRIVIIGGGLSFRDLKGALGLSFRDLEGVLDLRS